jgi:hypothetical protein
LQNFVQVANESLEWFQESSRVCHIGRVTVRAVHIKSESNSWNNLKINLLGSEN